MTRPPRVLIVAEHASARFGGEAILPVHYFRGLRERGVEVQMVVHERTRDELLELFPDAGAALHFVRDTALHRALWAIASALPRRIGETTVGVLLRLVTQRRARAIARELVRSGKVDVVHQPIPVSPKDPSLLAGLGAPVLIGPMNGGMAYPAAFARLESGGQRAAIALARKLSGFAHAVLRGKREAATLLVANRRTAEALPSGCSGRVVELVENGVDFATFDHGLRATLRTPRESGALRAIFVGRLVDWKALDVVLEALVKTRTSVTLDVVGDGPMRAEWERLARELGLGERVRFLGFTPQSEVPRLLARSDVLVLPSVYECGGAVVLEAMAMELPAVATAWGGPLDYLDETCGVLVPPSSRDALVGGFAKALDELAQHPDRAESLGARALERVRERFDWRRKIDAILELYADARARY